MSLVVEQLRSLRPILLASALSLAACGGGGSKNGGPNPPPETYLFLQSPAAGVLTAVDPKQPGTTLPVETGPAALQGVTLVTAGTFDAATGLVTGAYTHSVVYWKDDGTGALQLFRVPAVRGATPPAPVRVSSLSLPAEALCEWSVVHVDYAAPAESLVVIETGGEDGDCLTAGNALLGVPLSAGAEVNPIAHPTVDAWVPGPLRSATGAITGWLLQVGSELHAYEGSWGAGDGRLVVAEDATTRVLHEDSLRVWADVGGALRVWSPSLGELTDPGGVATPLPPWGEYAFIADERYLYLAETTDAGTISRVKLDGSAAPEPVFTLPAGRSVAGYTSTSGRIVYQDATTGVWYAVPKGGGAEAVLNAPDSPEYEYFQPVGAAIVFSHALNATCTFVREDGTGAVTFGDEATGALCWWVGADAFPLGADPSVDAGRIVLSESGSETTGTTLTAIDPATGARGAVLGTLPAGLTLDATLLETSGPATLLSVSDADGNGDVFLVDTTKAGSLTRITETLGADERPVGTMSCGSGAGGPAALALATLALARARRRRARSPELS